MYKPFDHSYIKERTEDVHFNRDARNNNIILGTALGLLIGFCALVYVLMVVIS